MRLPALSPDEALDRAIAELPSWADILAEMPTDAEIRDGLLDLAGEFPEPAPGPMS